MPKGKVVENGKQKVDVDPRTRYLNAGADDYYELGSSKGRNVALTGNYGKYSYLLV
jgi:formylmethanofuran dehydrogenase subunit D